MPLLKLETTVALDGGKKQALLVALSRLMAGTIGKPEQYVMVTLSHTDALMSGKGGDAAFADVRSIGGLTPDVNRKLAAEICRVLKESAGIPADRVYINFRDVPAEDWGWNGATFG